MDKALASVKGHALFVFRGYFRNDVADALLHGILFQTAQAHPANAPAKMGGSNEVSDGGRFPECGYRLIRTQEAEAHYFPGPAVHHGIRRITFHAFQNMGIKGFRQFRIRESGRSVHHVMVEDTDDDLPVGVRQRFKYYFFHHIHCLLFHRSAKLFFLYIRSRLPLRYLPTAAAGIEGLMRNTALHFL